MQDEYKVIRFDEFTMQFMKLVCDYHHDHTRLVFGAALDFL